MAIPPEILASIHNESDVEQKLLYPLLIDPTILNYKDEEVYTKEHLAPLTVDKGAGKKVGYYPDYLIILASIPCVVIEAKNPNEDVAQGFREAQLYAHEVNKRYPSNCNPVNLVIACNGSKLLWGTWDSSPANEINTTELIPGLAKYEEFKKYFHRDALLPAIQKILHIITPNPRIKALKLIGGPSKQNQELPPNNFASDLIPLLKNYFDPEITHTRIEIIKKAYVSTNEVTRYNSVLESLLKDNLGNYKFPELSDITTDKQNAPQLNITMKEVLASQNTESFPLLLLIGNVGSGKSMFIHRYYYYLMDQQIKNQTLWVFVDFNRAPDDLNDLVLWIVKEVLQDFPSRNQINDFYEHEMLLKYFAPQIQRRKKGPYKTLAECHGAVKMYQGRAVENRPC